MSSISSIAFKMCLSCCFLLLLVARCQDDARCTTGQCTSLLQASFATGRVSPKAFVDRKENSLTDMKDLAPQSSEPKRQHRRVRKARKRLHEVARSRSHRHASDQAKRRSKAVVKPHRRFAKRVQHKRAGSEQMKCADLLNHGTHFTVEIEVGTPGQKFDVVADTGSDAIIVPSCSCVRAGYCSNQSRCFLGTNRSSSFSIQKGPDGPPAIRMMFGSGPVQAVVASDIVKVGNLQTKMNDGILLMTDHLLNINGPFEGILGLGLPSNTSASVIEQPESGAKRHHNDRLTESGDIQQRSTLSHVGKGIAPFLPDVSSSPMTGGESSPMTGGFPLPSPGTNVMPSMGASPVSLLGSKPKVRAESTRPHRTGNGTNVVVKGFMEEAGIKRFSICFNNGAAGVLRLGTHKQKAALGSVGHVHWGLDFRGISVGNAHAKVQFCKPDNMTKGQSSPCGAIPDSGTTAFMAPAEHLMSLYESICDDWDRCRQNYTAMVKAAAAAKKAALDVFKLDPWGIHTLSKSMIFQRLLFDCKRWLTSDGLDELPSIHFHVVGADGTKQAISLNGWSYVIETHEKQFKYVYKRVPGYGKMPVGKNFTGNTWKVCSPAFSTMDYNTKQNGPVWIFGTPIFYEYQVGYDLEAQPPAISFSKTPCGFCSPSSGKTSLVSQQIRTHKSQIGRQPRRIDGPWRMPDMDFSKPL